VLSEQDDQLAVRLGFQAGQAVMELGWGEDADEELRAGIETITDADMLSEGDDDPVDVVVLWFREDDGDLTDTLVDAQSMLDKGGIVWLLTPKNGQDGHVEPADIAEAVQTAGLSQTTNVTISTTWNGTKLTTSTK
jgi:hypothetical protein